MQEIMTFVADYGVTMVISAIFLYAALQLINFGLNYLKRKTDDQKHSEAIDTRTDVSLQIQMLVDYALAEVEGDRITVMEFHNSTENLAHLPFCYMTCSYESYREGLLPVSSLLKGITTSLYSLFLTNLQKQPYVILDTRNRDPGAARAAYELIAVQEESSALCVIIRSLQRRGIGYVSLKKDDGEYSEKEIGKMRDVAKELGMLLTLTQKEAVKRG
jgi:hypothetical protein